MKKKCGHINDCGCKDKYLTTPLPCPPGEPCEEAQPCSYYTDFQCVIYTGPTLMCGEEVLLETGSLLSDVITDLAQRVCELEVLGSCNIITTISQLQSQGDDVILEAVPQNGSGNYTYSWSIADNQGAVEILTSPFDQQITVGLAAGEFLFPIGHVRVVVTDTVTGCQSTETYLVIVPPQV
jgi:hypothetical protein